MTKRESVGGYLSLESSLCMVSIMVARLPGHDRIINIGPRRKIPKLGKKKKKSIPKSLMDPVDSDLFSDQSLHLPLRLPNNCQTQLECILREKHWWYMK